MIRELPRWAALAILMGAAVTATAQTLPQGHPPTDGSDTPASVSDVPAGDGTIVGLVAHPDPGRAAGLAVALYALGENGRPGLRDGVTGADGRFRFEGVSTSPDVIYLVGARYRDVPFGARVRFSEGQREAEVRIDVSDPLARPEAIRVAHSELRIEWLGPDLMVTETHRLANTADAVVYVPPEARTGTRPVFEGELPVAARDFSAAPGSFTTGLEQTGRSLRFWGPVYPDGQEVVYRYRLPVDGGGLEGTRVPLNVRWPSGTDSVALVAPEAGPHIEVEGFRGDDVIEADGRRWRPWVGDAIAAGGLLRASLVVPPASRDTTGVAITRSDLWVEVDDAAADVRQEVQLSVPEGSRLFAPTGEPLLRFSLPPGARWVAESPEARDLGVAPDERGDAVLRGPLPPGESRFAFRYLVPVADPEAGARLELGFPAEVSALNLLIADTGVVVEDSRLHRLKPFRQGTRVFLHREAFHVSPDEKLSIALRPLRRPPAPRWASLGTVLLAGLLAAGFVIAPLRPEDGPEAIPSEQPRERLSREREALYQAIHDLDHDFETGKLAEADYRPMRDQLRSRAIEALRHERQLEARSAAAPSDAGGTAADSEVRAVEAVGSEAAPAHCPACDQRLAAEWKFCAGCGAAVAGSSPHAGAGTGGA